MLLTLAISGYRSLRDIVLPLEQLTVVTGANGSGKSSLYRSLHLLSEVAQGRAIGALAVEGGLSSTLWAGPENIARSMRSGEHPLQGTVRKDTISLKLGFASDDYGYAVDLGLPKDGGAFPLDPEIKAESVWVGEALMRRNVIAERHGPLVRLRDQAGHWQEATHSLPNFDSMMTHAADPRTAPELLGLRERMRNWRFYDHLRIDRDTAARHPQAGTRTMALGPEGSDLAAAILTLREIGDGVGFDHAIDDAFPGARVEIDQNAGLMSLKMHQHGLLRPLSGAELSDGTLRFVLLATALMTPRPPELIVLNEPETSLHPDLMGPLARLIAVAARNSQILVVSHASALTEALAEEGAQLHALYKNFGETRCEIRNEPRWNWPKR